MATRETTTLTPEASYRKPGDGQVVKLDPAVHRRVLTYLNDAVRPDDLVYEKVALPHPEIDPIHVDNPEEQRPKRKTILEPRVAEAVIRFRDEEFPLGFRHVSELLRLDVFTRRHLDILLHHFGRTFYGQWTSFPQPIPRRGPGGYDGVVHAAMLHTGQVLFITADETTLL